MYEGYGAGRCNWRIQPTGNPYAIGPRLGVAYQINSKTVFPRAGMGRGSMAIFGPTNNFTGSAIQGRRVRQPSSFTTTNPGVQPAFELKDGFVYDRAAPYRALA